MAENINLENLRGFSGSGNRIGWKVLSGGDPERCGFDMGDVWMSPSRNLQWIATGWISPTEKGEIPSDGTLEGGIAALTAAFEAALATQKAEQANA